MITNARLFGFCDEFEKLAISSKERLFELISKMHPKRAPYWAEPSLEGLRGLEVAKDYGRRRYSVPVSWPRAAEEMGGKMKGELREEIKRGFKPHDPLATKDPFFPLGPGNPQGNEALPSMRERFSELMKRQKPSERERKDMLRTYSLRLKQMSPEEIGAEGRIGDEAKRRMLKHFQEMKPKGM